MWKWLKDFFAFAVWERNASLALVIIAMTIAFGPAIYSVVFPPQKMLTSTTKNLVASFVNEYERRQIARAMRDSLSEDNTPFASANPYEGEKINPRFNSKAAISYFLFDPNKIGVQEWVQLGFSEKQAEAIERIKSKGFKFYKPEDLARLNIIGDKNAARLYPYVQIASIPFPKREYDKPTYAPVPKEKFVIDVNTADSSLWERQKGIGPKLAQRIVNYRNRLGGFIAVEQVKEVWGLPDSTYQGLKDKLVLKENTLKKINVNEADLKTMGTHPYINFSLAKVIVAYRKEHGRFSLAEDLRKLPIITDSLYRRMEPYISTE